MKIYRLLILSMMITAASTAPGQVVTEKPIISEFLPNPSGSLESEWIELYNPNTDSVWLHLIQIGDSRKLYDISDSALFLRPGEYIILAWDVTRFLDYFTDFSGQVTSPAGGWPALNNDGDIVRLADFGGLVFDSVIYDDAFPDNRSWERFIDRDGESVWGGSFSPAGATPGGPNSFFAPRTSSINLGITPDPFSPDGDGFEETTVISFNPPEAESFELVIYDISGRKVKTFFESEIAIPGEIVWDGRDDFGNILPIGIYIVYASVEGGRSMSTKRTVVIAR